MDRRDFLKPMLLAPAGLAFANVVSPKPTVVSRASRTQDQQPRHLPIGCDLSLCALQWAVNIGREHNLGKPKILYIGPENKFVAREILGWPHKPYTADSEINALQNDLLGWEVIRWMPFHTWKLVFEYGVVISEGPR